MVFPLIISMELIVMQLLKNQLGDAAAQVTFQKLAEVMNGLNNRYTKHDLEDVLGMIKKELKNDACFAVYEGVIALELVNYNYHKWSSDKKLIVAQKIAARLGRFATQIAENSLHYPQKLNILLEISQDIKHAIADNKQNDLLLDAILANNADLVCERLAAGADPAEHIHLTISDSKKTHLLPLLLRAGVNPSEPFRINGIVNTASKSISSIKDIVKAPVVFIGKVSSEVGKEGFNLINYAVDCGNEEALDFLLSCDPKVDRTVPIYYSGQCEEALQAQIVRSGKYEGGSALTVALLNHKKKDYDYRSIAIKLLRAGAKLQVVKKGSLKTSHCNNLQLMVNFKFESLLNEVLVLKNKTLAQLEDLNSALQYKGDGSKVSKELAAVLAKTCSKDIQMAFVCVEKELAKCIHEKTKPKNEETKHRSIKIIPQAEGGDEGREIQRVMPVTPSKPAAEPKVAGPIVVNSQPGVAEVAQPDELGHHNLDDFFGPTRVSPERAERIEARAEPAAVPLVQMQDAADPFQEYQRPTPAAKSESWCGCFARFFVTMLPLTSNNPPVDEERKYKLE